jgi:hypothetical protein
MSSIVLNNPGIAVPEFLEHIITSLRMRRILVFAEKMSSVVPSCCEKMVNVSSHLKIIESGQNHELI